jgi:ribosomal protein S18 acetylase RimI-like enzyme
VDGAVTAPPALAFRHPVEGDQLDVIRRLDAWTGSRTLRSQMPRLWFRHFSGTCWLAEREAGSLAGFAVGFVSADRPLQAVLHVVAVDPNLRRRGVGRALVERLAASVRERGATQLEAIVWAGDPGAIGFLRALGFTSDDGPGTTPIYGTPAFADYDADGDDKARLAIRLA